MSHMNAVVNANFLMIERQGAPQSAAGNQTVRRIQTNRFAFYGRLDRLKGIRVFLDAVTKLMRQSPPSRKLELLFVGTPVKMPQASGFETTQDLISNVARTEWPSRVSVEITTSLSTKLALNRFRDDNYIVVLPSLGDNYPCTLLETISWG